jgi:hypothetical protein
MITKAGVNIPTRLYYYLLTFNDDTNKDYILTEFQKLSLNDLTKDEIISLTNHAMLTDLDLNDNNTKSNNDA